MSYSIRLVRMYLFLVGMVMSCCLGAADIYVTSTGDSGVGTLRWAVDETVDGDIIRFDPTIDGSPILLDSAVTMLNKKITLLGNGVGKTIISGGEKTRVIEIYKQSSVLISGVSIIDGYADNYAGVFINHSNLEMSDFLVENNHAYSRQGGGIGAVVDVHIVLRNGVIAHNTAKSWAGGIYALNAWLRMQNVVVRDNYTMLGINSGGGGAELLFSFSTVLTNSSFVNNSCMGSGGYGGGLIINNSPYFGGNAFFNHSTISGNTALASGGGLSQVGEKIIADGLTIANNTAKQGGGYAAVRGTDSELYIRNSIIADNMGDSLTGDLYTEWEIVSNGYNLIENDPGHNFTQRTTDIEGKEPSLQPLDYLSRTTAVHPLDPTSIAVDAGERGNLTPDQRGRMVHNDIRDIGAFETGPPVTYADVDMDGFGDPNSPRFSANTLQGYVTNGLDNCPLILNADQLDSDNDGVGDVCDNNTSTATDNFELTLDCNATVGEAFELVDTMGGYIFAVYTGDTATGPPLPGDTDGRIVYTVEDVVPGKYSFVFKLFTPYRNRRRFSNWVRVNDEEWRVWSLNANSRSWLYDNHNINDEFELVSGTNTIEIAYNHPSVVAMGGLVATILDRQPVGIFRSCRNRGLAPTPPPPSPPANTFHLTTQCAAVGSSFELETAATGEVYAVYKGQPTYTDPPTDVDANRLRFVVPNAIAGNYHIFAYIDAPSSSADSYWLRINDGGWLKWASGVQTQNGFEWKKVMNAIFNLKDGRNTIDFAYREPNISLAKLSLNTTGTLPNDADGQSAIDCGEQPPSDDPGTDPGDPEDEPTDPDPDPEPEDPDTFTGQLHLGVSCAQVGSSFTVNPNPADQHLVADYRGTASMSVPPADVAENRIRFTVNNAVAGDYTVSALIVAPNSGADSYWVRMNEGEWIKWYQGLQTTSFAWKSLPTTFTFVRGTNTIDFAYREPDMQFKMLHLSEDGSSPGSNTPSVSTGGCSTAPPNDPTEPPTDPPTEPPGSDDPQDEFWLEAECASVGSSFERATDGAASEGSYVTFRGAASMSEPPVDVAANRVRFVIERAVAGQYQFYARIIAPDGNSDSFWVRINDGPWIKWASGLTTTTFAWKAVAGGSYELQAGANTVDIAYREPNVQLDKVYLQLGGASPTGLGEPATGSCE